MTVKERLQKNKLIRLIIISQVSLGKEEARMVAFLSPRVPWFLALRRKGLDLGLCKDIPRLSAARFTRRLSLSAFVSSF